MIVFSLKLKVIFLQFQGDIIIESEIPHVWHYYHEK